MARILLYVDGLKMQSANVTDSHAAAVIPLIILGENDSIRCTATHNPHDGTTLPTYFSVNR